MFTHASARDVLVSIAFVSHAEIEVSDEQLCLTQIAKARVVDDTHARFAIDEKFEMPTIAANGGR